MQDNMLCGLCKAVSYLKYSLDVFAVLGMESQFLTQRGNMIGYAVSSQLPLDLPYVGVNLLFGKDNAGAVGQQIQEIKLFRGQIDGLAPHSDRAAQRINQ